MREETRWRIFMLTPLWGSILLLLTAWALAGDLPDPLQTPGAVNRNVTQANIRSTICVPGWTRTVRPPTTYTNRLKALHLAPGDDPHGVELDHLIPLALGGHPRDPHNLWNQHWGRPNGAHEKDTLEAFLHRAVCRGRMPLDEARECIRTDWLACYRRTIGEAGAMR